MEPSLKKKKGDEEMVVVRDRLSEMPDEIILHILCCLSKRSTIDAVRTMLIRRFGNLWTLLPSLSFDSLDYMWRRKCTEDHAFDNLNFVSLVRNVLMAHRRATIDALRLSVCEFAGFGDPHTIDDVNIWLRFAVDRKAKEIRLTFRGSHKFVMPRCVLTSSSLVTLVLSRCRIDPQNHLFMGSLRTLKLTCCSISNESFTQLISGCPSLQELAIEYPLELHDIRIKTPTLNKLSLATKDTSHMLDCPCLKILDIVLCQILVDVIDVSSLQEVNIKELPYGCSSHAVEEFLWKFRNAEVLSLSNSAFKDNCNAVIKEPPSPCVMPHLKTVTIYGYKKGGEPQLQLAEFFLKHAPFLENLIIVPGKNQVEAVEELKFVKQVSTLRRASFNASVIFA